MPKAPRSAALSASPRASLSAALLALSLAAASPAQAATVRYSAESFSPLVSLALKGPASGQVVLGGLRAARRRG
jgi:hypothetical protein